MCITIKLQFIIPEVFLQVANNNNPLRTSILRGLLLKVKRYFLEDHDQSSINLR